MKEKIEKLKSEIENYLENNDSKSKAEEFKQRFLSKKGEIQALFNDFKTVSPEEKKEIGQRLNMLKLAAMEKMKSLELLNTNVKADDTINDMTRNVDTCNHGSKHPLSLVRSEIIDIFSRIGFSTAEGPEIEDDWHLFTALNFPPEHPARDMQDTFFIDKDIALRTHTSSVQIRYMEENPLPIRKIFPGRVFRNEAISARAHCIFHQVEGLYIDKHVSFKDLKQVLMYFAEEMFGHDTKIRLRPSYFPFTEPSAEMDISCNICGGKGCNICKGSGWVEILGCGMVDPNVLKNCNIDPNVYSGYAFGMGVERITMLKYNINDIRLFFDDDSRFLKQFENA
ncbi:MAG: phenylalanine--tRNA ligase subunit alpha [Bacteroidales bacterium]|jgi:phenylalanyl-tRNA synthetase alpha chain|nr:phenylalanine--tRNA ligase subunit alpha [Bacteroidales bacterium]MDD2204579.1 phenylalanine--tRNA ligase subunit alpha [Bacteroidales bacterium]MDD3151862.1 phenylalanine--tRNA ligase subunit alpha [Bacteroidales bacterium]MDD3914390.1 phenylalanine--tRNA ligase subunit alpha [Bacteroidales bacterium]MDD4633484.1 phenylalanine--tRNA ligase subunit alpha [Bacteroidales bacterium]